MKPITRSTLRPVAVIHGALASQDAHGLLKKGVALVIQPGLDAGVVEALADEFRAGGRAVTIVGASRPGALHD